MVRTPNTVQVWRQPSVRRSHAATTGIQTLAKPTPMLVNASARPAPAHKPLGDDDVDDHVAHHRITAAHQRQTNGRELIEAVDVTEKEVADADDDRADRHQPAPAVAIHQRAD